MQYQLEEVTPETAAEWLAKFNTGNRSKNHHLTAAYVKDMLSGGWHQTGDTIKFNGDGRLLDGQHRLQAVVDSGVTQYFLVVRNLTSHAQDVMDAGMKRSFGQVLQIRGYKNASTVAGITAVLIKIKSKTTDRRITNPNLLSMFERHETALLNAARAVCHQRPLGIPASNTGALYFITKNLLDQPKKADELLHVLAVGTPNYMDDPIHALREKILVLKSKRLAPTQRVVLWASVTALNLFLADVPRRAVRWPDAPTKIDGLDYNLL